MRGWPAWLAVLSLVVLGLLIAAFLVWMGRSELRTRRQARAAVALAARYRRDRRRNAYQWDDDEDALAEPLIEVTVAELVDRVAAEGLAVRLRWENEDEVAGWPEEWPTGVIPRVEERDE